eukprot:GHVU01087951.1.p1 GENE.GHVU01087951.1~~GHVU01087951.1.p1  ORF type:complete len:123 (-),score=1.54 GHVU01087951.1:1112-1480(-)
MYVRAYVCCPPPARLLQPPGWPGAAGGLTVVCLLERSQERAIVSRELQEQVYIYMHRCIHTYIHTRESNRNKSVDICIFQVDGRMGMSNHPSIYPFMNSVPAWWWMHLRRFIIQTLRHSGCL